MYLVFQDVSECHVVYTKDLQNLCFPVIYRAHLTLGNFGKEENAINNENILINLLIILLFTLYLLKNTKLHDDIHQSLNNKATSHACTLHCYYDKGMAPHKKSVWRRSKLCLFHLNSFVIIRNAVCIFFFLVDKALANVSEYHAAQTTQTQTWSNAILTYSIYEIEC